jgi:SAM-dependent methyltransferase
MNRKERRASHAAGQGAGIQIGRAGSRETDASRLFADAARQQHQGRLNEAVRLYKQVLALAPDHAEASNNLGCVFLAQGKLKEARARFARALALVPQLYDDFASVCALLVAVSPALGEGMKCAAAAWPQRLPAAQLMGPSGAAAIAGDPLLAQVLESTMVRDLGLERLLTCLRQDLLQIALLRIAGAAGERGDDAVLASCCALARQCFINEYVFATTTEEAEQVARLQEALIAAHAQGGHMSPLGLAALAMYVPLHRLPQAQALGGRSWPPPLDAVVTQQVREPMEELELRSSIARVTAVADDVSLVVRQQYEEHPYPRWVHAAVAPAPMSLNEHLRRQFPTAAFEHLADGDTLEILVAGCGTGRHPIEVARQYRGARILAIDLSLASLCYAKRKTPPALASQIEYAQADILESATIGRTFDLIEASGVLHHLAEPFVGWRALLALLRPGGFMHVGLYSELARRDVVAARAFIAERGYRPTADGIRECRQELLNSPLKGIARAGDFFGTSECRDLLFHVQERRMTLPQIKSFLADNGLRFIGFEFAPQMLQHYRGIFGGDSAMRDLDRWHAFEMENPDTFAGMYQFWIQRS